MTISTSNQTWPVENIHPYENNAKLHDTKQVAKIAASMKEHGWIGNPIVVNEDGVILAGHGRRLAAISAGLKEVPVQVVSGMSEGAQKAFRLADNRVAISAMDTMALQRELESLEMDMSEIFDKKELEFMAADLGELNEGAFVEDLDVAIELQAEETEKTVAAAAESEVKIEKALGFKSIKGRDERAVAMFMAEAENETGLNGAEAFIDYITRFSFAEVK